LPTEFDVASIATESLFPKIIRNAALIDNGDPVFYGFEICVDVVRSKRNSKRVARMGASAQFSAMYLLLKYDNAFRGKCVPVNRSNPPHTEPLPGNSVPVLEAGITNVAHRHATVFCEALSDPMCVRSCLFNPQVIVFAIATEFDTAVFYNDKVAWVRSN
jgi:hypothetical protein